MTNTPSSPYASLLHNAVLLIIHRHRFGITRTVNIEHAMPFQNPEILHADPQYLKIQKRILDCPEYQHIVRLDHRLKTKLDRLGLPMKFLPGLYIIPANLVEAVEATVQTYQSERREAVEQFLAVYPEAQARAILALNSLFDPANYPSVEEVRRQFTVETHYLSFDVPTVLQTIDREIFEREQQKARDQIAQMIEEIRTYLRATFRELVAHLADRLTPSPTGERKVLRQSVLTNLLDFLDTFESRNLVANDQDLADLVARCRAAITDVDPRALKHQPALAQTVHNTLQTITQELDTMIVPAPRRRFRFPALAQATGIG